MDTVLENDGHSSSTRVGRVATLLVFVAMAVSFAVVPGSEGSSGALSAANRLAQEHRLLSAAAEFEAAALRPRGDPTAHARLGDILLRRGQEREAADSLKLALAGGALDRRTFENLASAQERSGDQNGAFLTLRQTLVLWPDDTGAWVHLVRSAAEKGTRQAEIQRLVLGLPAPRSDGARGQQAAYLLAACLLDPTSDAARAALSVAMSGPDAGTRDAARNLAGAARESDAGKRAVALANALLAEGLIGPAAGYLDSVQNAGGVEAERQALLGYIYLKTGSQEEATRAIARSQELDPGLQTGQLVMGRYLRASGKPEEAVTYLQKAARQKPPNPAAYVELANALVEAGDYGDAEQSLKLAVQASPDDGELHLTVADFYVSREIWSDRAVEEAKEATRLLGRTPATLGTLGWALYLNGQTNDALQTTLEAVTTNPESALLRYRLGSIYEHLGYRQQASRQYELVREMDGTGDVWKRAEAALNGL